MQHSFSVEANISTTEEIVSFLYTPFTAKFTRTPS